MTAKSGISRMFSALWTSINVSRKILLNLIFFGFIGLLIIAISSEGEPIVVNDETALVLDLSGVVVEQKTAINPVDEFIGEAVNQSNQPAEVLLSDVLTVIEAATQDDRVKLIVLDLKNLTGAGLNKLESIGDKLIEFKQAGKKVYAIGDHFNKSQYFLASYADEIMLNPMGFVLLDGYNNYQIYFKSALEKLKVSTHVFRVGTYKSFVEPFIRDDMSDEAKAANKAWLGDIWDYYKTAVAARRKVQISNFDEQISDFETKFKASNYDFAKYALKYNWVDKLASREQIEQTIAEQVGWQKNKQTYNKIQFSKYLQLVKVPEWANQEPNKIAVIVARGSIQDGNRPAGEIGGDSTAKLLERARLDDSVKAVVIRIDSPGGSAFASEIIRRELDLLKNANKPVIASMSSVAASGGYWIASSADEIWAHPTTITGSIGVFGMFLTVEKSLAEIGIHTDGVSTTEWPALTPTLALNNSVKRVLQKSTETTYHKFLTLVSENRNMSLDDADAVAQGRVWSGQKALELGLVDKLGNLEQAIESAAALANVTKFKVTVIEKELTPQEQFIKEILGKTAQAFGVGENHNSSSINPIVNQLAKEYHKLTRFNDPQNIYALCEICEVN